MNKKSTKIPPAIFKESPKLNDLINGNLAHALWIFNHHTQEMHWLGSDFAEKVGLSRSEQELSPSIWKQSISQTAYEVFLKEISSNDDFDFRVILDHHLNKQRISLLYQCRGKLEGKDNNTYSFGVFTDISSPEKLISEWHTQTQLQRYFFESSPDALYLFNENAEFLPIPGRKKHHLDYVAYDDVVGKSIKSVFSPEISRALKTGIQALRKGKLTYTEFDYQIDFPNVKRMFRAGLHYISNQQFLAVVRDMTEEKMQVNLLNKRSKLQTELLEISKDLIADFRSFNDHINRIMAKIGRAVDCDRVYVFQYDFYHLVTSNIYEWCAEGISPEIDNLQNVPLHDVDDEWLEAHRKGEIYQILNLNDVPDTKKLKEILLEQGIKSLLTVPIGKGKDLYGFVGFDWVSHYFIPFEEQINLLRLFSDIFYTSYQQVQWLKQLEIQNKFSNDLIQEISTPFIQIDHNGEVIRANAALSRLLKLPENKIVGQMAPYSWWPPEEVEESLQKMYVIHLGDYQVEMNFMDSAGRKFPVLIKGQKLHVGNEVLRYATITDLSANQELQMSLEESQNWLSITQQAARLAHFVINLKNNAIEISTGLYQLLGVDPSVYNDLSRFRNLVPSTMIGSYIEQIKKSIASRSPVHMNIQIVRPDNHEKMFLNIRGIVNYSRTGEALELQATVQDISKEMSHLQEIERQNQRLKEIAWLHSHDLRTPLVRILSVLETIDTSTLDQHNQASMSLLRDSAEKMDQVIGYMVRRAESFGIDELIQHDSGFQTDWEVVIVDDDILIRELARQMLLRLIPDKEVKLFDHGASFMDYLRMRNSEITPHDKCLVLLDINMPQMNGWEVLKGINNEGYENCVNVAMFSSSVSALDKKRAMNYPFVIEYLEKPLRKELLSDLLKTVHLLQ